EQAELVLRDRISLLGGPLVILRGARPELGHAPSGLVEETHVSLRHGVAFMRGRAEFLRRALIVALAERILALAHGIGLRRQRKRDQQDAEDNSGLHGELP